MLVQSDLSESSRHALAVGTDIAYSRMRRWLGIAYVGTIVLVCSLMLTFGLAKAVFSDSSQSLASLTLSLAGAILFFTLCSLPFDIVGFNIERMYNRTKLSLSAFLIKQVGAALKHDMVLLVMALAFAMVSSRYGVFGMLLVSALSSFCLISGQLFFAKFYGGISTEDDAGSLAVPIFEGLKRIPLLLVEVDEPCFTGGIVGLPGLERIVIPRWWLEEFSPPQLSAEVARRSLIVASGGRFRGVLLAVAFTNIGVLASASLTVMQFSLPLDSAAGLVTMSALFTLWSFLGLLTLPYFSHQGVYEADRLVLENGVPKEDLLGAIAKVDSYVDDESERTTSVDTVFHPVPTVSSRIRALSQASVGRRQGAWQAARYAVFLSVIGLGLLGRAVHCNAGKSELWAMLPAD